jgi:hypothetical protein
MTICTVCKLDKGDDFRKARKVCRECCNIKECEKRKLAKEKEKPEYIICNVCKERKTDFRINRGKCMDCEREHGRNYRKTTDKAKIWSENNRERMSELQHNWYDKNKKEIRKQLNERMSSDENFKEIMTHRHSLCRILRGVTNKSKYLNCNSKQLQDWLSFKFTEEMTLDNYGEVWTIDHVIPVNLVLRGTIEKDICFDYLNLQPVLKNDNLRKNKHVTLEECQQHLEKVKKYIEIRNLDDECEYVNHLSSFCVNFAKHLVAGNTLESSDTTSSEKSEEGTRLIAEPNGNNSEELVNPQAII